MNSRIDTLLSLTGMEHRRYGILPIEKIDRIGFKRSDAALIEKKNEAWEYLRASFEKIRAGTADQDPDEQVGSTGHIKSHLNNKTGTMTDRSGDESIETAFTGKVRTHREDCSGCTACFHACPVQCIQMKRDGEGFLYPEIDLYRCIHCDICRVVCKTAQTPVELRQELRDKETDCRSFESLNSKQISSRTSDTGKAYIAYVKDRKIRHGSSSGGLFSVIAGNVLSKGGTVYGACFDGDFTVCHKAVTEISELASLRGSKYVQSDPGAVFPEIREKLDRGEVVFFSGTPCQVDGLLAYLGKEYDNLYTQDIICHGVPSPLVWKEYLSMRSKGKKVLSVSFRDKTFGWRYFSMNIETDRGKYIRRLDEDIYLKLFLDNVILRPSCYACHHKNIHRRADFTLADAWENITGLKDDDRGISKLFASSPKAQNILEEVKESVFLREILFEDAVRGQKALTESVLYNQDRELFFALAKDRGMQSVLEDWYRGDILPAAKAKTGYWKYRIARRIRSR